MTSIVSSSFPSSIRVPSMTSLRAAWLAHPREDRVVAVVSFVLLAVVLAVTLLSLLRPMPWSPVAQEGSPDRMPQIVPAAGANR